MRIEKPDKMWFAYSIPLPLISYFTHPNIIVIRLFGCGHQGMKLAARFHTTNREKSHQNSRLSCLVLLLVRSHSVIAITAKLIATNTITILFRFCIGNFR